jgi:hypothetical protein
MKVSTHIYFSFYGKRSSTPNIRLFLMLAADPAAYSGYSVMSCLIFVF